MPYIWICTGCISTFFGGFACLKWLEISQKNKHMASQLNHKDNVILDLHSEINVLYKDSSQSKIKETCLSLCMKEITNVPINIKKLNEYLILKDELLNELEEKCNELNNSNLDAVYKKTIAKTQELLNN